MAASEGARAVARLKVAGCHVNTRPGKVVGDPPTNRSAADASRRSTALSHWSREHASTHLFTLLCWFFPPPPHPPRRALCAPRVTNLTRRCFLIIGFARPVWRFARWLLYGQACVCVRMCVRAFSRYDFRFRGIQRWRDRPNKPCVE